eukprot:scaffold4219_cov103-Isochrysis_galbana.AAC.2
MPGLGYAQTRLCPDSVMPGLGYAQIRGCPDSDMPRLAYAQTRVCQGPASVRSHLHHLLQPLHRRQLLTVQQLFLQRSPRPRPSGLRGTGEGLGAAAGAAAVRRDDELGHAARLEKGAGARAGEEELGESDHFLQTDADDGRFGVGA